MLIAFRWIGRRFKKEYRLLSRYERSHPHFRWYILVDAAISILLVIGGFQLYSHLHSTESRRELLEHTGGIEMNASKLVDQARAAGIPIYWLGPTSGSTYSLNQALKSVTILTYIPQGSNINDVNQARLSVETYSSSATLDKHDRIVASASARKIVSLKGFIVEYDVDRLTSMTVALDGVPQVIVVEYPKKQSETQLMQDVGKLSLVAP